MKKVSLVFLVGEIILFLAAAVHVSVVFVSISHDLNTSFPADVVFLWLIPYAFAALVWAIVWLIVLLVKSRRRRE